MRDRRPHQQVTQQAVKRVERVLRKAGKAKRETGRDGEKRDPLTEWESEFLSSLKARLEAFGSAFTDPNLGAEEEALSIMQNAKLHEVSRSLRRRSRPSGEEKGEVESAPKLKKGPKKQSSFAKGASLKRRTPLRRKSRHWDSEPPDVSNNDKA